MKLLVCIALLGGLAAGGCGGRAVNARPDATTAQEEHDYRECDYEASKLTIALPQKDDRNERLQELRDKCMRARGYQPN